MDFSIEDLHIEDLHTTERNMKSKIQDVLKMANVSSTSELNGPLLTNTKFTKSTLANFVISFISLVEENVNLCKSAAEKVEKLKDEQISNQQKLIKIQQDQSNSVEQTVKSEFKSWADVAKKNCNQRNQLSEKSVEKVLKSVNDEERRSRNLMIYGFEETKNDEDDAAIVVRDAYVKGLKVPNAKNAIDAYRVGKKEDGKRDL